MILTLITVGWVELKKNLKKKKKKKNPSKSREEPN
jgi:hypothetical protein